MGWEVEVRVDGETILTIGDQMLSGKPEFTRAERDTIRQCADHLRSFIGDDEVRCEGCDQPIPDEGERNVTADDVTLCADCWAELVQSDAVRRAAEEQR